MLLLLACTLIERQTIYAGYGCGYELQNEMHVSHTHTNTRKYTHILQQHQTILGKNHNVFTIQRLFDRFITPCIDYIIDGLNNMRKQNPLKRVIHQTNLNMVTQFCCMFDAMFPALNVPTNSMAPSTCGGGNNSTKFASISMWRATSTSIDDDAIIECGFIDVKIQNVVVFYTYL